MEGWFSQADLRRLRTAGSSLRALVFRLKNRRQRNPKLFSSKLLPQTHERLPTQQSSDPKPSSVTQSPASRAPRHRALSQQQQQKEQPAPSLIRSSACRSFRQPTVPTATVTTAQGIGERPRDSSLWTTLAHTVVGTREALDSELGPRLGQHPWGPTTHWFLSSYATIAFSHTPCRPAATSASHGRDRLTTCRASFEAVAWKAASHFQWRIHASAFLNPWTSGTLSLLKWIPIISSAIGVHMELLLVKGHFQQRHPCLDRSLVPTEVGLPMGARGQNSRCSSNYMRRQREQWLEGARWAFRHEPLPKPKENPTTPHQTHTTTMTIFRTETSEFSVSLCLSFFLHQ